ncbi:aspartate kinase [Porphyromonas canoris]|uniref:aspartate kinase n=1 Tax=Porphyromonas canoris TaxID=36875 RepID=UPI00051DC623|nr:aspartate kinase [Porphyromonas canoris]KGL53748.1 aspartate kinase [Porphyromonas canoris]
MNTAKTIIMKFGGTSVGSAERIKHVGTLISDSREKIIVLSAMAGVTNKLVEISKHYYDSNLNAAKHCIDELKSKYMQEIDLLYKGEPLRRAVKTFVQEKMDYLWSFHEDSFTIFEEKAVLAVGELISTEMMCQHLNETGIGAVKLPALDFMRTDKYGEPDMQRTEMLLKEQLSLLPQSHIYITEGFICKNAYDEIDNLQRGGSDYTASIIGAVLEAKEIQIWTDIDGMHNNDPRIVKKTDPVRRLHFEEAAELAYFGAKILHPTCILPAKHRNIPVRLLNSMDPSAPGTLISNSIEEGKIKAIAAKDNITVVKINSSRMLLAHGFMRRVFETFERHQTAVDMVTTSEVSVSLTIDNASHLQDIISELKQFASVSIDSDMVSICIVGDLNWKNIGFESAIIKALDEIPVRMISYGGSNYNVTVLVQKEHKEMALEALSTHLFYHE